MTDDAQIISIDVGTSSVRATLVDSLGRFLTTASSPLRIRSTVPGAAEQDAEDWWAALVTVVRAISEHCTTGVAALTLSTQQVTTVPVGADGLPLELASLWLDQRPSAALETLDSGQRERIRRITGMPPSGSWAPARVLWWRQHQPELAASASAYLTVDAYLYRRLGGPAVTDPSTACFSLLNLVTDRYDDALANELGIDIRTLAEVAPSGTDIGPIGAAAAAELGLPCGIRLVLSGSDQPCAAIGVGATDSSRLAVTNGTGTFVTRASDKPLDDPRFLTNRSVGDQRYLIMGMHYVSGAAWSWFADVTDVDGRGRAASSEFLLAEIWSRPEGRKAPVLLPYLSGSRTPHFDDRALGTWVGISLSTTRADLAYSVLESNGFGVREIVSAMVGGERDLPTVRLAGGPAVSDDWCRLQADASALEVERTGNTEATTLGAALVALTGLGVYDSVSAAADTCVGQAERFTPDPSRAKRFAERRTIYGRLYAATRDLSHA